MARSKKVKTDTYVEQAIVQLLSLKLRTGSRIEDLHQMVEKCVNEAMRTTASSHKNRGLDIHRLGSVLRIWHKEAPYLTFDGIPRPLKLDGRVGLRSLVRRVYPTEKFDVVFKCLLETKLIKQCGKAEWAPSGRTATIQQVSPETLEHLAEGVFRYVETVTRNVTAKDERDVLFERSCKVTRLPTARRDDFREYVAQQALAFLTAVDDWLENRVSPSSRANARTCTAGVYTFAYVVKGSTSRATRE